MRPHPTRMFLALAIAAFAAPALAQTPPPKQAPAPKQAPSATPTAAPTTAPSAAPAQAPADDVQDDAADVKEKVRALFKEGNKHYRAKKWAEAEAAYEAAYAITGKESKSVVNNLGQTKMHLKKYREAAELLSAARRLADKGDKQLADIERDFAEARKHIGTIVITASVDGAKIFLGDKEIGVSPLPDPVFIEPGKASLTASADGYETVKTEIDVAEGQSVDVPLALLAKQAAPPPPPPTETAPPPPPPTQFRNLVPGIVGGGLGVIALGIGGALLGAAHGAAGDIDQRAADITAAGGTCPSASGCTELESAAKSGDTMSRAGVGLMVGGFVLAAAGGTYIWWTLRKPKQGSVQFIPVASHQGGGFTVSGAF